MPQKNIIVKGAREHNLKNVDVEIPRDKLVVFTGLSGSGKSSLAFDTIYAEGQRRYVESLSSYARQFLGQMEKPQVDYIEGLSPAISIDQKTTSKNPRSTVGTVTEIYDYLRLLYARIGIPHCPVCGREISRQTVDDIVDSVLELPEGTRIQVMAPIARGKKGQFVKELESAKKDGYVRVRVDGIIYDLSEKIELDKNKKHNIEIVVDRLVVKESIRSRLADSIETATGLSNGILLVDVIDGEEKLYSLDYACPEHGVSIEELEPRMFSFNNPFGACPTCSGLSVFMKPDPNLIVPDKNLSLRQGAIKASGWNNADGGTIAQMYMEGIANKYGFTLDTPFKDIPADGVDAIMYGTKGEKLKLTRRNEYGTGSYMTAFEGICNNIERRYKETTSDWSRAELEQCMSTVKCPDCHGARLRKESLCVTVGGINIDEFANKSIVKAIEFLDSLTLTDREQMIAKLIVKEIKDRLTFLRSVGLGYLTLARSSASLSGGESQRIRLATQIGSSLVGVLYSRRAEHRTASARQRKASEYSSQPQGHRQHAYSCRARRGHDARGGLHRRCRPGRGYPRRKYSLYRHGGRYNELQGVDNRAVSQRSQEDSSSRKAQKRQRKKPENNRRTRKQSQKYRCRNPARRVCVYNRRIRFGQIVAYKRDTV